MQTSLPIYRDRPGLSHAGRGWFSAPCVVALVFHGKAPGFREGGDIGGVEDILVGVEPAVAGVETKERPGGRQHLERGRGSPARALPPRHHCLPADMGTLQHRKPGGKRAGAAAGGLLDRRPLKGDDDRLISGFILSSKKTAFPY